MYRIFRNRVFLGGSLFALAVSVGAGYYLWGEDDALVASSITQVSTGSVTESVRVLGEVSRVDTQTLTFGTSGKIQKIYVKEGQSVKVGDVLAQLDTKSLDASIKEQQLSVQNASLSLNKLKTPAKTGEVLKAEKELSDARLSIQMLTLKKQNTLLDTKKETESIQAKIQDLSRQQDLTKERIAFLESNKDKTLATTKDTQSRDQKAQSEIATRLQSSLDATDLLISQLAADIDQIYGLDSYTELKSKNEIFVSGKSSAIRRDVVSGYQKLKARSQALSDIRSLITSGTLDDISEAQTRLASLLSDTLSITTRAIEGVNSSITDVNFSDAILSGYESRLSAHASNLTTRIQTTNSERQALNALTSLSLLEKNTDLSLADTNLSINDLANTLEKLRDDIRMQERQKVSLERQKETTIKDLDAQINQLQSSIGVSQALKSDLLDGADIADIALQKNAIARAQAALDRQRADRDNMIIRSTFTGVIDKIDFRVGDIASSTKGITISSPGLVNVESQIDQVDIVKIRVGNSAEIAFDAYPGRTFSGVVSQIESYPQNTDGVVLYTTTIALQKSDADIFLNGMTAELKITQSLEREALFVPSIAVSQSGSVYEVTRLKPEVTDRGAGEYRVEEYEIVSVTLGQTVADRVEILSGLSLGDRIVIPDFSYSDAESRSIFGGPPERDNSNSVRQIN